MLLGDFLFSIVVGLVGLILGAPITIGTFAISAFVNKSLGL